MNKKTILIIEDEQGMRDSLEEAFTEAGYQIILAEDGEKGVAMAKEKRPDIVMLDIVLPKKDGFEVLKELMGDEETKNLRVVLTTNLSEPSDIQKALDLGATTYLVKSNYSLKEIVQKVDDVLKK